MFIDDDGMVKVYHLYIDRSASRASIYFVLAIHTNLLDDRDGGTGGKNEWRKLMVTGLKVAVLI